MKFVAIASLLLVGSSFRAEAAETWCGYTPKLGDRVWHYAEGNLKLIQSIADKNEIDADKIYDGKQILLPCEITEKLTFHRAEKQFVAPVVRPTVPTVAEVELPRVLGMWSTVTPQIPTLQSSAPEPKRAVATTEGDGYTASELAALSPKTTNATISTQTEPQIQTKAKAEVKPAKTKNAPVAKKKPMKKFFQVVLNATGAKPGSYPAIFLNNQDKKGYWHGRKNMPIVVEEANGKMLCRILLERKPETNSAVVIDFGGQAFYLSSDDLANGETVETGELKGLRRKAYHTLHREFPVKRHPLVTGLRVFGPTAIRSGLAFASIGPQGLVLAPASLATDILMRKLRNDRVELERLTAPRLPIQYQVAGQKAEISKQSDEIGKLKTQIATLMSQLNKLQQTVNEVTTKEGN